MLRKYVKFPLEQLQFYIFTEIVFGVRCTLRLFIAGHTVTMVTYSVMKMIRMCSPIIKQVFFTMIVTSTD